MSKKEESPLKSKLMRELKLYAPGLTALRHEDVRTSGIPDLSTTGYGRTCWWEFKHATPKYGTFELQELTMRRLAVGGFARYIIYIENKNGEAKRTLIVHPNLLKDLIPENWTVGFNHRFVVEYIRKAHHV